MSENLDESLIGPLKSPEKKPLTTDNGRTPGPWRLDDRGIVQADPRPGTVSEAAGAVAFVYSPNNPVGVANGRLIDAAPDLLAACEALLDAQGKADAGKDGFGRYTDAVELARAAVAKATR